MQSEDSIFSNETVIHSHCVFKRYMELVLLQTFDIIYPLTFHYHKMIYILNIRFTKAISLRMISWSGKNYHVKWNNIGVWRAIGKDLCSSIFSFYTSVWPLSVLRALNAMVFIWSFTANVSINDAVYQEGSLLLINKMCLITRVYST